MRLLAVVAVVVVLQTASTLAQQCDSDERWLLVNVTAHRIADRETGELKGEMIGPGLLEPGPRIVDLCLVTAFSPVADVPGRAIVTLIYPSSPGAFQLLFVKESLEDICAALPSCRDATE